MYNKIIIFSQISLHWHSAVTSPVF